MLTSVIILVPKAFLNSLATPVLAVPVLLNVIQKSEQQYMDTRLNVPPNSTSWPDIRNELFSIIPLTSVLCSINTTCYTSIFLAKHGLVCSLPPPWQKHGPRGAWKPAASLLHPSLPSQKARMGRIHVNRGKVDFISRTSHSGAGPGFVEHVFGERSPVGCWNPDGGRFPSAMSEFYICGSQQVHGANEK